MWHREAGWCLANPIPVSRLERSVDIICCTHLHKFSRWWQPLTASKDSERERERDGEGAREGERAREPERWIC